jgi:pimeloyl-ACP methyl ester carboxylesterase
MTTATIKRLEIDGLNLAYREQGSGPTVLLLHGWPTSSFLWREVMEPVAAANHVVALDLPGFGGSDKPLGVRYGFDLFDRAIDGFLAALGVDRVAVAAHDLGGPIGLHWALGRRERLTKLALLNTLVYPHFSEAVVEFVKAASTPGSREALTSPEGLEAAMRLGLADETVLTEDVLAAVRQPFGDPDSRHALANAGIGLEPEGFVSIAEGLPTLRVPLRIVYGERDRILPDIAQTVQRVREDVPDALVTALPDCGHFLQEEAPEQVGELLASFFADES